LESKTVIEARSGFKFFDVKELIAYKDLFYFLVLRDITVIYKQTILGFAWAIINPVFSMVVFSVIFGRLARVPSDGVPYPIFAFAALLPWNYFSQSMINSTNSLISNSSIFTKVYFPRIVIPLTPIFSKLVDFSIAFVILIIMMILFGIAPSINIIFLPFLILLMILTSSGIGMWFSALAIQYRDVKFAVNFLSQILMYIAPVVWPTSLIEKHFGYWVKLLYGLYPMAGIIEGFRASLLGKIQMPWDLILVGTFSSVIIFFSGLLYFRRTERIFADVA
jgi:lipopolysaccharide transport system permease protein